MKKKEKKKRSEEGFGSSSADLNWIFMKNSNQSSVSLLKESGSFKFEIKAKHKPDERFGELM